MFDFIKNLDAIYYVLWGIGVFGLLFKMLANTYLKGMIRASENMATTKRKFLRVMRQKYENGRNMGLRKGDGDAFVEKNVRTLKFMFVPLETFDKLGKICTCLVCITLASGFLIYDANWRGSPVMIDLFVNGVIVIAFLVMLENIFLINNKMEILKANIRDYLDNGTPKRELTRRPKSNDVGKKLASNEISPETAASIEPLNQVKSDTGGDSDKQNEEILNRFLKEFFS